MASSVAKMCVLIYLRVSRGLGLYIYTIYRTHIPYHIPNLFLPRGERRKANADAATTFYRPFSNVRSPRTGAAEALK